MISLDTLRADHLGCYGYPIDTSPNIDYYSKKSVLFSETISQDSNTTPSHMTLFTSLFPSVHCVGQFQNHRKRLRKDVPTLAAILKSMGYKTAAFTSGGNLSHLFGFNRGFDKYLETDPMGEQWDYTQFKNSILPWFQKEIDTKKPLFCFIHTYRIHDPYLPPSPLNKIFNPNYKGKIISSKKDLSDYAFLSFLKKRKIFWDSMQRGKKEDLRHLISLYDGEIRYADLMLGFFFDSLDPEFFNKKTITIFLSDHGEEFLEHNGFLHKDKLYDELLRVPLIFRLPEDTMKGLIKTAPVSLIDVVPTILGFLGIKQKQNNFQGHALLSDKVTGKSSEYTYSENMRRVLINSAIRTEQWKYIFHNSTNKEELYHLVSDPMEKTDISSDKDFLVVKNKLKHLLEIQMKQNKKLAIKNKTNQKVKLDKKTRKKLKALGYIQ